MVNSCASLLKQLLACLALLRAAAGLPGCFTESQFVSTCEPPVRVASGSGGIRSCFRPDLPQPPGAAAGESVAWDTATGVCERRPTTCGAFVGCPAASASAGRCLVSCDVAERGFLALSIRAGVGVKSFELADSPDLSNCSVRGAPDNASLLPDVFRASTIDQLPAVAPRLTFKEAIVRLFVVNTVVVTVTFDLSLSPHELSRSNWFSRDRLKSSWPVTELGNRTFNFFGIPGHASIERRWFISYLYNGCPGDRGLMVALDVTDFCPWAGNVTSPPKLIYSTQPDVPLETSGWLADKMAVILR